MNRFLTILFSRHGLACLAAAVLLCLCLASCSGEIYDPTEGSLSLQEGTGNGNNGTGNSQLELPTEPPTGDVIIITPTGDPFENAEHVLRVDVLNVGDADATLLRMDDTVILIDTGESNDSFTVSQKLDEHGITTIDYLIISHYDNDHIGAASQILQNYTVKQVYMPDYVRKSSLYSRMMSTLDALSGKTAVRRLHNEDVRIELSFGSLWINATGLYQAGQELGSDDSHALEENNYSLITSVYFGDTALLFAGDAENDRIKEFSDRLSDAECAYDFIKIPHHGGFDKELGNFLRRNQGARYFAVCVNDDKLVDARLVTAMRTAGAPAYYTCKGHISYATDGKTMLIEQK